MLSSLFSFRGRLDRRAYLVGNLTVFGLAALIVAAYLGVSIVTILLDPESTAPHPLAYVTASALVALLGWVGLALNARRVRDAGHNPWLVVGAACALAVLDISVFRHYTDERFFWLLRHHTMAGGSALTAFWVALMLWPSAPAQPASAGVEPERDFAG